MNSTESDAAADAGAGHAPLVARLFSVDGKMIVTLLDVSATQAVATTQAPPPTGSIAVVTRNSVRLPATVASSDGGRFTLTLDEPLHGRRREQFVDDRKRGDEPTFRAAAA